MLSKVASCRGSALKAKFEAVRFTLKSNCPSPSMKANTGVRSLLLLHRANVIDSFFYCLIFVAIATWGIASYIGLSSDLRN